jgi:NAD(P)H-dependent flavin oxidoreductase YrpB (nitropropane dioxygenase family)
MFCRQSLRSNVKRCLLLPAVADAVGVPVIAAGGAADGRGVAAALILGASAVEMGSAFLCCPKAELPPASANAIGRSAPEQTIVTRAYSGRTACASPPILRGHRRFLAHPKLRLILSGAGRLDPADAREGCFG